MTGDGEILLKFRTMMRQKDSTSKFVALFLLLEILSKHSSLAVECWSLLDPSFLDKLVLSAPRKGTNVQEAEDLQSMGCSVLLAYSEIDTVLQSTTYLRRSDALLKLYLRGSSSASQSLQIEQILCRMVTKQEGAINLISNDSFLEYTKRITNEDRTLGISTIAMVLTCAVSVEVTTADLFHEKIVNTIALITARIVESPAAYNHYTGLLQSLTSSIATARVPTYFTQASIQNMRSAIRTELLHPGKAVDYADTLILIGSLMRLQGHKFLLQDEHSKEDQQFLILVSALAASEIRTTLAWLVDNTRETNYGLAALKVASCYDTIRLICLYLVNAETLSLKADDILKVRDNFSAAFGETIAYLRDRWDHSPLCPTAAWHVGAKALADSQNVDILKDPSLISGTQALALWLEEDESAHRDANGIMDVFLGMIKESHTSGLDYGLWLIPPIQALLQSEKGLDQFSHFNGTKFILDRLDEAQGMINHKSYDSNTLGVRLQTAALELEILYHAAPEKVDQWEQSHRSLVARIQASNG